jgi:hypothetical protein
MRACPAAAAAAVAGTVMTLEEVLVLVLVRRVEEQAR